MFFYEGEVCPVCGKPFHEHEDIVSCPVCGTPHHRVCWREADGCHNTALHEEDYVYAVGANRRDREAGAQEAGSPYAAFPAAPFGVPVQGPPCPRCGRGNPPYAEFCGVCGLPLRPPAWGDTAEPVPPSYPATPPSYAEYTPLHHLPAPHGGVRPEEPMGDATAGDVIATVAVNTRYYLPRFRGMEGRRMAAGWNWAAFLLTPYWLLFRKQYVAGGVALAISMICNRITTPLMTKPGGEQMAALLREPLFMVAMGVQLLMAVAMGLLGNWLYRESCLGRIRRVKRHHPEDYAARLPLVGGVSHLLALLGCMLMQMTSYLPMG